MRSDVLATDLAAERSRAIRLLLRWPMLNAHEQPDGFREVVRHHDWLIAWFDDTCGWQLIVDPGAGRRSTCRDRCGDPAGHIKPSIAVAISCCASLPLSSCSTRLRLSGSLHGRSLQRRVLTRAGTASASPWWTCSER